MKLGVLAMVALLAAGPALAQGRIDPKDLKPLPKLPQMAAPSNLAGTVTAIDEENVLVLDLSSGGRVRIAMRPDVAPKHVERIKTLARKGFYDGTVFHRVIDGFMAQGGDPTGTGTGGSDLPDLKAEFNDLPHVRGAAAMARAQSDDSANSQFYIVLQPVLKLDRTYTIWGRVISGMSFVDAIAKGEPPQSPTRILKASIGADKVPPPDFAAIAAAEAAKAEAATPIPAGALAGLPSIGTAPPRQPAASPAPQRKRQ